MLGKLVRVSVRSKNSKSRPNLKRRLNLHSGLLIPMWKNMISVGSIDRTSNLNCRVFMYFSFSTFSSFTSSPCSRKPVDTLGYDWHYGIHKDPCSHKLRTLSTLRDTDLSSLSQRYQDSRRNRKGSPKPSTVLCL